MGRATSHGMRIGAALVAGAVELGGLVWPVCCAGCGRPDVGLCPPCAGALGGCPRHAPVPAWPEGPGVWAASAYRGVPATLIVAWKDRERHDLTAPLARALAGCVAACGGAAPGSAALIVPVPTSWANRRRRGADLVHALAVATAREVRAGGWAPEAPPVVRALRHVRRVRDQADLGAGERWRNLHGALEVRSRAGPAVAGRRVLIVDDVVTTGATLAEAGRALTSAGAHVVGACCLCVTTRQQGVPERAGLV